ncbi:hypothetical protein QE197_24730 (plasmid) [Arsenophonus nasoniae]|uniref:Uncharacterized protein n=1 Tax=Arsenophonus nasoniae TaxID=638 RepID=A0A4P7L7V5_9GAMM|nr:hypothetical protein [Arsenophonus nasoniae]QBY45988.1 hypothetical protein ArsFIN_45990 [Arsenophonus nasoniae]WGM03904.1 hypothetical protein QE210_20970 [Arsenophonus nasoniae]WGM08978.1 hypothetical protein QE258_26845 [Arsenophonus nasoniae]WGM13663.1 hypothetical protein QE197_24730 [Arsenophonus nasoniae]WGM18311.1 hypothetical protein QE193_24240 [Arsenophonus nasoniae]
MSKKIVYDDYVSIRIPREVKERIDKIRMIKKSQGYEKYRLIDAVMEATNMLEESLLKKN